MAEYAAVRFLVQTIGSLLVKEVFMVAGWRGDLEYIQSKLDSIQSLLKDEDRRKKKSTSQKKTWINKVRDVAYDVQDLIDEFIYYTDKHEDRDGFIGFLKNVISLPRKIFVMHRITTQLQEIKAKVLDISESSKLLLHEDRSSEDDAGVSWPYYAESSHFAVEEELVGIDDNRKELISWLKDEEPQRKVLSVVGMGGLGKTTLVTRVCKNPVVKQHFQCYAWISLSQSYKNEELLRRMMKELYNSRKENHQDNIGQMDYMRLVQMLINYLQDKRYVIVLDDVWNKQAWDDISIAIPNNQCGSRVMLTSRIRDLGVEGEVFHLQPLQHKEAWGLFCRKAFWNIPKRSCPQELEAVAKKIAGKCEGLPLAIVAIGGMMSRKERSELEWEKVEDSLSWELSNNPDLDRMKNVLLHSYYDLPYHLKNCFLYCSVFPEDYIIRKKKLFRLWMAEGFVVERRGLTMDDVAENYLKELIHRSMIQVAEVYDFARARSCRLHDVMRDLALSLAEEENFCMVYDGKEAREDCKARRLSIQMSREDIPRSTSVSPIRSLFVFGKDVIPPSSLNKISTFRKLRVLDLQDASIHSVPDELAKLFNLRYLSLRNTNVRELPESLGRLRKLETLDTRGSKIKKLPAGIKNMKSLRHLYMYCYTTSNDFIYYNGTEAPSGICKLKSLQTLMSVEANTKIVRQVGNLTQLRRLDITKVKEDYGLELCSSIQKMEGLLYLSIMATSEEERLQLEELSSPPHRLQKLCLTGLLEKLPHWIGSLANLSCLCLDWSKLQENPLPLIGSLPNLVFLWLNRAYDGQCLHFLPESFPSLETVILEELKHLNHVRIDQGAMPSIQAVSFLHCQKLKILPEGIEQLSGLQELFLREMPEEFTKRLQGDASEDRKRVSHIQIITNAFWSEGKWVLENLSQCLSTQTWTSEGSRFLSRCKW